MCVCVCLLCIHAFQLWNNLSSSKTLFAADGSKTSEYAFFKKLKKDAGVHKQEGQFKDVDINKSRGTSRHMVVHGRTTFHWHFFS